MFWSVSVIVCICVCVCVRESVCMCCVIIRELNVNKPPVWLKRFIKISMWFMRNCCSTIAS